MSASRRLLALLLGALAASLLALAATAAAAPPTDSTLGEIESEVMCPVCGTLLQLAESPQAQRQKAFVSRLIDEGRSKEEIKDALVAEYGNEVLALPQDSGFDLSAYVVPIVALVIAVIALALGVMRWRRDANRGPGSNGSGPSPRGPSDEDAARLDADLARYDL
ncbi:MAG TPA: cytochrome c-type biogenesis protein [Solirubrobacterales bacterium]|nr:cytochrome c-type biogenesis protein [Solirubrobacterales bacterium]